jgi:hypothetical protein
METIGAEGGFRFFEMEMDVQPIDAMDLEQNGNGMGKIIHKMWTRTAHLKIMAGPSVFAAP